MIEVIAFPILWKLVVGDFSSPLAFVMIFFATNFIANIIDDFVIVTIEK